MIFITVLIYLMIISSNENAKAGLLKFNHDPCLSHEDRASWTRNVFYDKSPLIIESTKRSSHKMVSFIMAILLKERLGYENIVMRETRWDDTTNTLNRLTCERRPCQGKSPLSHINLEVWMSPGFTSREWVSENLIIDCGPLGPSARTGIFHYNDPASKFPLDDWRLLSKYPSHEISTDDFNIPTFKQYQIFRHCNESISGLCKTKFAIDPELPPEHAGFLNKIFHNWTILQQESDNSHFIFFNWYPNTITVQFNFSRVLFPDCNEGLFSSDSDMCEDSVNQLTKVIWSGLRTKAPLIYRLIDSFQISDQQLHDLLKTLRPHSNTEVDYFRIACDWIKSNQESWMPLTNQWNSTKYLNIIVMLPKNKGNISMDERHALKYAVNSLNNDTKYFGTLQYQLQIQYTYVSCGPNEMLEEYLDSVNIDRSDSDNPVVGIISALPTECMELVSKITNAQKKVTISYRHEILPMSQRYKNSSYIFQTLSSKETYYSLLLKISKHFDWSRNVIITDNKDYKSAFDSTYILLVYNEESIDEHKIYEFLKKAKEKYNAKQFFIDFMSNDIFEILCAAGRLEMTLAHKYVWIINMGLIERPTPPDWSHCAEHIDLIIRDYFYLSPNGQDSLIPCIQLYPDNLYRAATFLGRATHLMTKSDPRFTTCNTDRIVDFVGDVSTNQYFCDGKFIPHPEVKMEHNSLFWPVWHLYQNNRSRYISVFDFQISSKFEIDDIVRNEMRRSNQIYWYNHEQKDITDGRTIDRENCWAAFIARPLNLKCNNAEILIIIVVTLVLLIGLIVALLLLYQKKIRENDYPMSIAFKMLVQDLLDIDIHSSKLCLNHVIGKGAFGMVYGGEARNNRGVLEAVAVKAISETSDWVEKMDFLTEAKVMRKLRHQNIVQLTGVSLDSGNNMIFLIMELMVEGDLRNYLLSRRSNAAMNPESHELRARLTNFARDIAEGLNYMHTKFMVHRDVACRNCLISHDIKVKLGDFGLTRYLQPASQDGYYNFQGDVSLPVRWMPPEAIQFGLFSIKSDIWSFGILLFEIVTFGVCPYQDLSSSMNAELMNKIKSNNLSIVDYLPVNARDSIVHKLIKQCCAHHTCDRLHSVEHILSVLKDDETCIRPYLTADPPKSEVDKKLENISTADIPRLVFEVEELPVTSPSEIQLTSSQKYIDKINRAFGIKSNSIKDRGDFPLRELRPCRSSVTISRDLLSTEAADFMPFNGQPDLLIGSIPSDLCHNMGKNKINRSPIRSLSHTVKLSTKVFNNKYRFSNKDL